MASGILYAFRGNYLIISGVVILLPLYTWLTWDWRITLSEHGIFFKNNFFSKGISIEYSELKNVKIYKAYGTNFLDMIFHFKYITKDKKRIFKLNLFDRNVGRKIIKILKDKSVQYEYGDDYIEMILERPL